MPELGWHDSNVRGNEEDGEHIQALFVGVHVQQFHELFHAFSKEGAIVVALTQSQVGIEFDIN